MGSWKNNISTFVPVQIGRSLKLLLVLASIVILFFLSLAGLMVTFYCLKTLGVVQPVTKTSVNQFTRIPSISYLYTRPIVIPVLYLCNNVRR